uniref:Sulfite oxidase n=1 Tax=Strigamia maritima TaxID=126957 RepID=T1INN5_STRMM
MMATNLLLRRLIISKRLSAASYNLFRSISIESSDEKQKPGRHKQALLVGGLGLGLLSGFYIWHRKSHVETRVSDTGAVPAFEAGKHRDTLPVYSAIDVSKHDSKEKGIWCSFKSGVYDITDFVDKHPGGDKILMAAGGALEPFWLLYAVHQTDHVLKLLEDHRIGNLDESDRGVAVRDLNDPYSTDPKRHPALKPATVKPFNAEPPLSVLVDSYITPNDLFYVRNHLPVPEVDPNTYELEICVDGSENEKTLTLNEIKNKFEKHTVTAAMQCAGNRRSEMMTIKPIKGLNWGAAAIGNATWSGARLIDVLKEMGIDNSNKNGFQHVQFEGLDLDPASSPYGASILFEKAMDPDVILAYEMNGQPIPRDHGFPVRVIVPGVVGARNVKWVSRIVVSHDESSSHWQQNDYKGFPPQIDWDTVDFKKAPAIQDLPVQSAICEPGEGQTISREKGNVLTVKGYAWSGGGRGIVRVDVSLDGGENWHLAKLKPSEMKINRAWAWTLWQADIPLPKSGSHKLEICCRAVDSSYNNQPDSVAPIWNLRGVLNNAWHRIHPIATDPGITPRNRCRYNVVARRNTLIIYYVRIMTLFPGLKIRKIIHLLYNLVIIIFVIIIVLIIPKECILKDYIPADIISLDVITNVSQHSIFNNHRPLCPIIPHNRKLNLNPTNMKKLPATEDFLTNLNIGQGGKWQPSNCNARFSTAIIIPYRARKQQLAAFLYYMHHFLCAQSISYTIIVVEQSHKKPFNRGKLFNVGFKEALNLRHFDCFIFHDVDLLPENLLNIYGCSSEPRHLITALDEFQYSLPYCEIMGGAVALTKYQFEKINGFANRFYGWGGEDDDFYNRVIANNYRVIRWDPAVARYTMLTHAKEPPNSDRHALLRESEALFLLDGLSNLDYTVISFEKLNSHTRIFQQNGARISLGSISDEYT